jgi:two-component system chemotaxis sensor kinase CheA
MSDLLEQFLTESGDLLREAAEVLLAIERGEAGDGALDAVFRAVHTVKGSSGLFELPAFTRLVHAAEDALDQLRETRVAPDQAMMDALMTACDALLGWLEALEAAGALPADAEAEAAVIAAALRPAEDHAADEATEAAGDDGPDRAAALLAAMDPADAEALRAAAVGQAGPLTLLRYVPRENCFFAGEDPAHLWSRLPGVLAQRVRAAAPWPDRADFDPFQCNLTFAAVCAAPEDQIADLFRYVADEVALAPLPGVAPKAAAQAAPAADAATTRTALAILTSLEAGLRGGAAAAEPGSTRTALLSIARALDLPEPAGADVGALLGCVAGMRAALTAPARTAVGADAPPPAGAGPEQPPEPGAERRAGPRQIKVDEQKIDALMAMIGELVVAKNALPFLAERAETEFGCRALSREIRAEYATVDRLANEMQGAIMQVRMRPVMEALQRFPKLVRDIARKVGKKVRLEIAGGETEVDRAIIERLGDPLIHLVRNALDHGLETPDERSAAGKAEEGVLSIRARQEADQVVIEIADDGRGVDLPRVRAKAVARGLLTEDEAAALNDQEAVDLIFRPGFSTAEAVSDLSGRGVGMDVVATAIRSAGGRVSVRSTPGRGSVVRLSLPLSMAVTRLVIVEVGGVAYGVPMDHVRETLRLKREDVKALKRAEYFMLRGRMTPLLRLREVFGSGPDDGTGPLAVVVVEHNGARAGLVVDGLKARMDTILKPLEGVLAGLRGFSGTALTGDGRVLMVMDAGGLLDAA